MVPIEWQPVNQTPDVTVFRNSIKLNGKVMSATAPELRGEEGAKCAGGS